MSKNVCLSNFQFFDCSKKLPLEGRIYRQNLYTKTLEASTLKDSTFEGVEDQGPRNRGGRGVRTPTGFEKLKSKYAIKTANFRFLGVNCRIWAPTNVYCLRGPCWRYTRIKSTINMNFSNLPKKEVKNNPLYTLSNHCFPNLKVLVC